MSRTLLIPLRHPTPRLQPTDRAPRAEIGKRLKERGGLKLRRGEVSSRSRIGVRGGGTRRVGGGWMKNLPRGGSGGSRKVEKWRAPSGGTGLPRGTRTPDAVIRLDDPSSSIAGGDIWCCGPPIISSRPRRRRTPPRPRTSGTRSTRPNHHRHFPAYDH